MKLDEFQHSAISNLRNRRGEVVEALPAIAGIAMAAARGIGAAGKGIAKAASKGIAATAARGANATVGTQGTTQSSQQASSTGSSATQSSPQVSGVGSSIAQKAAAKAAQQVSQKLFKPGGKIPMPNNKGQTQQYEIDKIQGDEVTIIDPQAKKNLGAPSKYVVSKKDVDSIIQGMVSK
jgi:hypothetical protein